MRLQGLWGLILGKNTVVGVVLFPRIPETFKHGHIAKETVTRLFQIISEPGLEKNVTDYF